MQAQSYIIESCGELGKYRHPHSSCRHAVAQPIIPRILGCWSAKYGKLTFLANCHHQAKQGKVEAVLFTEIAEELCISIASGTSVIHCSQGFLSSLLLGMESKALFQPVCHIHCVFLPTILLHRSSPPFLGEHLEGRSMISLHGTLCAGFFCIMQT